MQVIKALNTQLTLN